MASNYPTSLDNFTNPTSNDSLNSPSHSLQHADVNDAIEAIEAKLGIGASSAGSATAGHVLTAGTGGTTTWSALPASGPDTVITSGTISAQSTVNLSSVLSDTYKFYVLHLSATFTSNGATFQMKFRENTTDKSTGYAQSNWILQTNGTNINNSSGSSLSAITLDFVSNTDTQLFVFQIHRPNATAGDIIWDDTYAGKRTYAGASNKTLTNFNGLSLIINTGTFSGNYILTGRK